jgi:hypothetical protein
MLTSETIEVVPETREPSAVVWDMLAVLESVDPSWKTKRVIDSSKAGVEVSVPTQDTDLSSLIIWPSEQYLEWQDAWAQLFPGVEFPLEGHTIDEARLQVNQAMTAMITPPGSSTTPFPTTSTTPATWTAQPAAVTPTNHKRMLVAGLGVAVGLGLLVAVVVSASRR